MGRSTREESLRTRSLLLATARTVFEQQGYEAASMEDVASRAGVTRGALYHHFGSKLGLFTAVVTAVHEEIADEVGRAAEVAGPGWSGIEAGCAAFMRAAASPAVHRLLLLDAPAVLGWRHWRSLDARNSRRLLEEGLRDLEQAGELPAGEARPAALLLSGAMNEAALWSAEQSGDEVAGVSEVLHRMLLALRTPP